MVIVLNVFVFWMELNKILFLIFVVIFFLMVLNGRVGIVIISFLVDILKWFVWMLKLFVFFFKVFIFFFKISFVLKCCVEIFNVVVIFDILFFGL